MALAVVACAFLASAANTGPRLPEGRLFTADLRSSDVSVYAVPSGDLLARIPLPRNPHELALSADRRFVYTALYHSNLIARIDARTYDVELLSGPPSPHGVATAGTGIAVTSGDSGSVTLLAAAGDVATGSVQAGRTPHAVAFHDGLLAVANAGDSSVSLVRLDSTAGPGEVAVGAVPESVAFTDDGLVLTANAGSNDISVVDSRSATEVARIPVSGRPVRIASVPGTSFALVAATAHDGVAVIDLASKTILRWIPTGPLPDGIAVAGPWAFTASTGGDRVTVAACLLFDERPQREFPNATVRVLRYGAEDRGVGASMSLEDGTDVRCEGSIPQQIMRAAAEIERLMPKWQRLGAGGLFEAMPRIPRDAWLEGLVNAVVHRSYSLMGDHIRVEIFPNRLEITSPGRFPGVVDPANPLDIDRYARNPRISRVCSDLGITRELGEGIRRMFDEMRRRGLADPLYTQLASSVRLVLLAADALPPDVLNELTPSARAMLDVLRLADQPLGTGQLAELAGISRMTATRALAQLRDREIVGWQGESAKDPRATWRLR